jgi:hypothetical protein
VNVLDELLMNLEESLEAEGTLSLYSFSWWLRGMKRGLSEDEIAVVCQQAYEAMTSRHDLRLEWFDWPDLDPFAGRPADPGTPLDFDINSSGEIDSPFLALVPDQSLKT